MRVSIRFLIFLCLISAFQGPRFLRIDFLISLFSRQQCKKFFFALRAEMQFQTNLEPSWWSCRGRASTCQSEGKCINGASKPCSLAVNGHQRASLVIKQHQQASRGMSRYQRASLDINGDQWISRRISMDIKTEVNGCERISTGMNR